MKIFLLIAVIATSFLSACKEEKPAEDVRPTETVSGITTKWEKADSLLGKWTGPEGTSLTIEPNRDEYVVIVENLDGPRSFIGKPHDDGIHFTRDGVEEVIHIGDGQDTGMKWLADKFDCIYIKAGEGFCRD